MASECLKECGSFLPAFVGNTHLATMTFCEALHCLHGTLEGTCLEHRNSLSIPHIVRWSLEDPPELVVITLNT
jgi:hypothetical protein